MTDVLWRRKLGTCADTNIQQLSEDRGRDGRDAATSPGTPGAPGAGRGGKVPPWSLCREHSPRTPGPRTSGVQDGDRMDSWAFSHLVCLETPENSHSACIYVCMWVMSHNLTASSKKALFLISLILNLGYVWFLFSRNTWSSRTKCVSVTFLGLGGCPGHIWYRKSGNGSKRKIFPDFYYHLLNSS